MSQRPRIPPQVVIGTGSPGSVSGDMSASITSAVTILGASTLGSMSYSWTGTSPVGTIALQISDDYALSADGKTVVNAGTWNSVYFQLNGSSTLVNSAPLSGNSGNGIIEFNTGAWAIRTVYTRTSGTGTLSATITAKVF